MSINDIGREGERIARDILKDTMGVDELMQADWMFKKNGEWYCVEVKHQDAYDPPPFKGHGLPAYQADMRMKFQKEVGPRCMFLVIDSDGSVYWQWLDVLEQTKFIETKNNHRRIYDIKYFKRIQNLKITA
jgi:hypothetical protein